MLCKSYKDILYKDPWNQFMPKKNTVFFNEVGSVRTSAMFTGSCFVFAGFIHLPYSQPNLSKTPSLSCQRIFAQKNQSYETELFLLALKR